MDAQIIQTPGPEWTLLVKIPAFTTEDLGKLIAEGAKSASKALAEENRQELACLTVPQVADLLSIKTVETVRGYGRLPERHPKYLPIIWGENALGDRIMRVDLKAWIARNKGTAAKDKITQYLAKHA